nr:hypothetical protein [Robiginitalea sp. SC105]
MLHPIAAQESTATTEQTTTPLFSSDETLAVRLTYSNRDLLRETNDSTYLEAMLAYKDGDKPWDSVEVRLQARGNWRKKNCFLAPVKVRIKKKDAKGTLFEGNKELKFVLPCNNNDDGADYVLREYIAYKLYELVTPYHFKTRRMRIDYTDEKKNKGKEYALEAFMIEDIKTVADRNNAKQLKRKVHPLQQDHGVSVQNDFFQFMIANTDYSSAYQHNEKLLFVEGRQAIPVPYDFDMSGFVNANYAVVSQVQGEVLDINSVTDRLFRGFKRDNGVYDLVRKQYLDLKPQFMAIVEGKKSEFLKERSYDETHDFIEEFFRILANDGQYRSQILAVARTE